MNEPKHEHIPFIQFSVVMGPHPQYGGPISVPHIYGLTKDGQIFRSIDDGHWELVEGLKVYEPIIEAQP